MQPTAHYTAEEKQRMERCHAQPRGEGAFSAFNYISPEEISARKAARGPNPPSHLSTSSSSSSSALSSSSSRAAGEFDNEEEENLGRCKRKKRPVNRFTPEARKGRTAGTSTTSTSSSSSASPASVTPAPKRSTVAVERRLELNFDEEEEALEDENRTVHRCPFEGCPDSSVASAGWLQRRALITHLNSVHLSLPGVHLPEEFVQTVQLSVVG